MHKKKLTQKDYEFMSSLGGAILESSPKKIRMVIIFWAIAIVTFVTWASLAEIDEIARGSGEVIPRGENQLIQNLEGGIVEEILTYDGAEVKKGDVLIKIDNQKSESSYESNQITINALQVKVLRLKAQANAKKLVVSKKMSDEMPMIVSNEKSLYQSNILKQESMKNTLIEQLHQKELELKEAKSSLKHLNDDKKLIDEEIAIIEPLVKRGIKSQYDFLKLKREKNGVVKEYDSVELLIPRIESKLIESKQKIKEIEYDFSIKAKEQLNEAVAKLKTLESSKDALADSVNRTVVRSPINGIVQKLHIHTVGGVVRPGADLVEIVPSDDSLLIEVKIKPSDIAFIYPSQFARVKFSAYDFAIFGSLEAKVESISADSITDEKGMTYFKVRIKTNQNNIIKDKKKLKIIPGMTVDVDIITGKKTVLDYILKPILKTKQYSFSEH